MASVDRAIDCSQILISVIILDLWTKNTVIHGELATEATRSTVFRVKAVFKVNFRFANQIIATEQIPVEYLNG